MTAAERGSKPVADRGRVWQLLGAPAEQEGSVNDPRTRRECHVEWNEKWVYLSHSHEKHGEVERIVLWNRYDLVGVFRLNADGTAEPESLTES